MNRFAVIWLACSLISFSLLFSSAEADWISDASYSCSDPALIRNHSQVNQWLGQPYPYSKRTAGDKIYVQIDQREFNEKNLLFSENFIINKVVLDKHKAILFSTYLQRRERSVDFPLWSQQLPAIPALALDATKGLVFSTAFAIFFEKMGAVKLGISSLELLVVDGGEITQFGSFEFENGNAILVETVDYRVKIGNEIKYVTLYTCLYPASVIMSELSTVSPSVNPKIFKSGTGSDWLMLNASTNSIERKFTKNSEDREFYYLKEIGGFGAEYRLSRIGGPVERLSDGSWIAIYTETLVLK